MSRLRLGWKASPRRFASLQQEPAHPKPRLIPPRSWPRMWKPSRSNWNPFKNNSTTRPPRKTAQSGKPHPLRSRRRQLPKDHPLTFKGPYINGLKGHPTGQPGETGGTGETRWEFNLSTSRASRCVVQEGLRDKRERDEKGCGPIRSRCRRGSVGSGNRVSGQAYVLAWARLGSACGARSGRAARTTP